MKGGFATDRLTSQIFHPNSHPPSLQSCTSLSRNIFVLQVMSAFFKRDDLNDSSETLRSSHTQSGPSLYCPWRESSNKPIDNVGACDNRVASERHAPETTIFTPGTTVYADSAAETTDDEDEGTQHQGRHCSTCICGSLVDDPKALKTEKGKLYNRRQLIRVTTTALSTYTNTADASLRAKQMGVITQALKQSGLPYTDALYQEAPNFPRWTDIRRDDEIRRLVNPITGFPTSVKEAYHVTCKEGTEEPRDDMVGLHARLSIAVLEELSDGKNDH